VTVTLDPLHPLLAQRRSPRAFDPAHELTGTQLTALLEAARWAPSASNTQPWRFAAARRGTAGHAAVLAALNPGNQGWAHTASALIVAAAITAADRPWSVYDTGQAVAHLTVQAEHEGLAVHQMGGFDRDRLAAVLGAPAVAPLVVVAVGQASDQESSATRDRLPIEELLLLIETGPSGNQIVGRHRAR
jgi:nitroreductase